MEHADQDGMKEGVRAVWGGEAGKWRSLTFWNIKVKKGKEEARTLMGKEVCFMPVQYPDLSKYITFY